MGGDSDDGDERQAAMERKRRGRAAEEGGARSVAGKKGGSSRHFGRRLVAKGATFALRAAALPLMHRALRAYTCNEGGMGVGGVHSSASSTNSRHVRQQQREVEDMEEEEADAQVCVGGCVCVSMFVRKFVCELCVSCVCVA